MGEPAAPTFLENIVVVELGQRLGAGLCGSLLAEAGARVIDIDIPHWCPGVVGKAAARATLGAGKTLYQFEEYTGGHEVGFVADMIGGADIVIVSQDCDPEWLGHIRDALTEADVVCDVTAFGEKFKAYPDANVSPPRHWQRLPATDSLIQAWSGVMDTSGEQDGPPAPCDAPIVEVSAALYAASGAIAALRARRLQHRRQKVEVALFDVAVGMLATFLPKNFAGGSAQRIGNHHPAMSPWNAFAAKDGWVLLCAGTNDQWARVAKLIGNPEFTNDPRFDSTTKRVANNSEVDALIEPWINTLTVAECVDKLNAISISTGPILRINDLAREPNLNHRGMVRVLPDGRTRVPGSPLRGSVCRGVSADTGNASPHASSDLIARRRTREWGRQSGSTPQLKPTKGEPPLAGLRVIEMGQFTTAPLVGRQMGALGAYVAKLEPDGGEPAREMPPHRNGHGFFFSLSNSDTRVMTVDLRKPGRVELLTKLIEKADVLVENTKPGTLARHGFTPARVLEINPRIVYVAISGFGIDAPYAGLGAMDTTIQGLAGIMDLTRVEGVPYKTGISIADLHAGQYALFATLAALEYRDRTGNGQVIDLAMLDAAAWVSRTQWNVDPATTSREFEVIACRDGHVLARVRNGLSGHVRWAVAQGQLTTPASQLTRAEFVAMLEALEVDAAPVLSVTEVLAHPRTQERGLVFEAKARDGSLWNLLKCPIRLSRTPAQVQRVPGPLNADQEEILRDWQIDWRAP